MEESKISIIDTNVGGELCVPCIVCDEPVPLTEYEEIKLQYGHDIHSKICDKCKQAILHIRKQIE